MNDGRSKKRALSFSKLGRKYGQTVQQYQVGHEKFKFGIKDTSYLFWLPGVGERSYICIAAS